MSNGSKATRVDGSNPCCEFIAATAHRPPTAGSPPAGPIKLDAPLEWTAAKPAEQKMLQNLQGNILKGHGRDATTNIFFTLGPDVSASKRALRELGNFYLTSAYKQLVANLAFKNKQVDGGTFCSLFISAKGYQNLGLKFVAPEGNDAFKVDGMKSDESRRTLDDPELKFWEEAFRSDIDGMVLVADSDSCAVTAWQTRSRSCSARRVVRSSNSKKERRSKTQLAKGWSTSATLTGAVSH
jgi:hypothetical protein